MYGISCAAIGLDSFNPVLTGTVEHIYDFKRLQFQIEDNFLLGGQSNETRTHVPSCEFSRSMSEFDTMLTSLVRIRHKGQERSQNRPRIAMGITVVASSVRGQKHFITEGINGFLAECEDEWYFLLKMLVQDSELWVDISENARRTVKPELSREMLTNALRTVGNYWDSNREKDVE